MFDHELPVAAIPEKAIVDLSSVDASAGAVEVAAIHHSTPRGGLITWDTKDGPSYELPANLRVPVNLPARKPDPDPGTQPRARRRS